MNYVLRLCIALDGLIQATFRYGSHGVTISSRVGTAAAHGHEWGIVGNRMLDYVLGHNHCREAIKHDRLRAHAVLKELSDPAVVAYLRRKS